MRMSIRSKITRQSTWYILDDKPSSTPGEEGLKDLKIMMAVYESARKGQAVKIT
jgi:predicted dehydrogenase